MPITGAVKKLALAALLILSSAFSAAGETLLRPDGDRALWGPGEIPNVDHLKGVFEKRPAGNFCAREYRLLETLEKHVKPIPPSASLEKLRQAVMPYGISNKILNKTLAVFLHNQAKIPNQRFLAIFDLTQKSTTQRFVVIDLLNGTAKGYRSAHGLGSDPAHTGTAHAFGNDPRGNTNKSSLGCALVNHKYRAKRTVQEPKGRWAISILGFEDTNDRSCDRGVYMHAAPYVDYEKGVRGSAKIYAEQPGRSWGCPAFTYGERDEVFGKIDGGGLFCAWAD